MNISVLKGLPVRTLNATTKDKDSVTFNVSTESVNSLVGPFVESQFSLPEASRAHYEEFDEQVKYYVPDHIFTLPDDKKVVDYINTYIHEFYEVEMSDNELIARFVGYQPNKEGLYCVDGSCYDANDLTYNSSWDWLIPVVEKCLSLDFMTTGNELYNKLHDAVWDLNKEGIYKTVVEIINWYNEK